MSPAKFHGDHEISKWEMIKGPRPSPLNINKGSHVIHKPSFSSSSSSSSQQKQPVIIYAHSPKIIHTQAQDFMALVQKLTGMSQPNDDDQSQKSEKGLSAKGNDGKVIKPFGHDNRNDSSSALTEENCGDVKARSSSLSPIFNQTNPYFADIPLFTPSSNNFFCSPRPVYRYPDSAFVSPNIGNSMSPSVLEFIKGLPEY
ncbi:hypothetical protein ACJW30_08G015000 [Castanea mollissima]